MRKKYASWVTAILGVPLLMVVLVSANCGDDDDDILGGGGSSGQGGATGLGGAGGAAGVDAGTDGSTAVPALAITIQNFAYSPANLAAAPGALVTVHNMDSTAHTVTSEPAADSFVPGAVAGVAFDTGAINPGSTATFIIPAGTPIGTVVHYYCTIHGRTMGQGQITVQ